MLTSSSIHKLNADKGLRPFQIPLYFFLNYLNNNYLAKKVNNNLQIKKFSPKITQSDLDRLFEKSSPSRKLTDLFINKLAWQAIKKELEHIHVLDIGCGEGAYSVRLQRASGGLIDGYIGIDIAKSANWQKIKQDFKFCQFYQADSKNFEKFISSKTNLLISISAIEHFEDDLLFFEKLSKHIQKDKKNVIQIHLFPPSECLKLYGLHGVRQYCPHTASRIANKFANFSYSVLYSLGGKRCNKVFWKYIKEPLLKLGKDYRFTKTTAYEHEIAKAIIKDSADSHLYTSFYALVIHSYFNHKIF